jgi:hypothetical protein
MIQAVNSLPSSPAFLQKAIHALTHLFTQAHMTPAPLARPLAGYVISLGRLPFDGVYVASGNFKEEYSDFGKIGRLMLIPCDLLASGILADSLMQGRLSANLGSLNLLNGVSIVSFLYGLSYMMIGIDSALILCDKKTTLQYKRQAIFDLANAVLQIALAVLFIVGYSVSPVLLVLGLIAAGVGIAGFIHRYLYSEQFNSNEGEVWQQQV